MKKILLTLCIFIWVLNLSAQTTIYMQEINIGGRALRFVSSLTGNNEIVATFIDKKDTGEINMLQNSSLLVFEKKIFELFQNKGWTDFAKLNDNDKIKLEAQAIIQSIYFRMIASIGMEKDDNDGPDVASINIKNFVIGNKINSVNRKPNSEIKLMNKQVRMINRKYDKVFDLNSSKVNGLNKLKKRAIKLDSDTNSVVVRSYQNSIDLIRKQNQNLIDLKSKEISDYFINYNLNTIEDVKIYIKNSQILFNEGYIEGVKINTDIIIENKEKETNDTVFDVTMMNRYPIGISSTKNIQNLNKYYLFSSTDKYGFVYRANLNDILKYQILNADQRDLSPANQTVSIKPNEVKILKKESTKELLKAHVFSDFVGLSNEKPNGLIQTEIQKRFNLVTRRVSFSKHNNNQLQAFSNFGFCQSINACFDLNKIEENNKFYDLLNRNTIINGRLSTQSYISLLDIIQFRNIRAGLDYNFLTIRINKSDFLINTGLNFIRTGVRDSVREIENITNTITATGAVHEFNIITIQYTPIKLSWEIKYEKRIKVGLSYSVSALFLYDDRVKGINNIKQYEKNSENINDYNDFKYRPFNQWPLIGSFEFRGSILTSSEKEIEYNRNTGELFFRIIYNNLWSEVNRNYFQAQVGYAFYLLKSNK